MVRLLGFRLRGSMAAQDHVEGLEQVREFFVERRRRAVIEAMNSRTSNPGIALENANRAIDMHLKIEVIDRARADEARQLAADSISVRLDTAAASS